MKKQLSILIVTVAGGCHSPGSTRPKGIIVTDTSRPTPLSENRPQSEAAMPLKTHLKDTTNVAGNFILFLRPDAARYDSLAADEDNGMGEADSDFGVGISNTIDSVKANDRYKNIRVVVSDHRYIFIKDCKNGPKLIDRDTVNYGVILSAPGKAIDSTYNSVHGGDYLGQMEAYFFK